MDLSAWALVIIASGASFLLGRRWTSLQSTTHAESTEITVSRAYLQGLNLLLNERGDDAVEAFLPLLDTHPEMPETHLLLGRLFRRRGEFDRAIRIHENLLKHAGDAECSQQALLELAQDYLKAGLLDRAENAFRAVLQSQPDNPAALHALADLFEQQQEWSQAIEVRQHLLSLGQASEKAVIAMLYCEIAEAHIRAGDLQSASRALRMAYESDPESTRGGLLAGKLALEADQPEQAIAIWSILLDTSPDTFGLIMSDFLAAADQINSPDVQRDIRLRFASRQLPEYLAAPVAEWIARVAGPELGIDYLHQQAQHEVRPSVLKAILNISRDSAMSDMESCRQLREMVHYLPKGDLAFQCCNCGYRSSSLYWKCPGCRRWDVMRAQEAYSRA